MKLRKLGNNETELTTNNGDVILFSYETPVAANLRCNGDFIRTKTKYSATTTKHINKWLGASYADEVDQSVLDNLCNGEVA